MTRVYTLAATAAAPGCVVALALAASCANGPVDDDSGSADDTSSGDDTSLDEVPDVPEPFTWVDAQGRAVLHRGVNLNSAAKAAAGGYHHGLSPDTLALLPAHGFTLVRLLVFWEALEPQEGLYDETYLAQVGEDVDDLAALGMEVVLDLHQDVFGQGFGFTGFPRWTCGEEQYAAFDPPDGSWFLAYLDPAVVACFDAFWASAPLQDAYAAAAARLAAAVGDRPAVVGLDAMNEPYWGSLAVDEFEGAVLPSFYGRVAQAVWAVRPGLRLFCAPSTTSNLLGVSLLELNGLSGGPVGFSPHFYPTYAELGTGYDGDFSDEADVLAAFLDIGRDQGVPVWLSEFGIFSSEGNETGYVRSVLSTLEGRGGSTAYWSFDRGSGLLDEDGGPGWMLDTFSIPRPHRLPGTFRGVDGDGTARFALHGSGTAVWVAPAGLGGCVADGAELGDLVAAPPFVEVPVQASGEVALRCE